MAAPFEITGPLRNLGVGGDIWSRTGGNEGGWPSKEAACAAIALDQRLGTVIAVLEEGKPVEYWWAADTSDEGLVEKTAKATDTNTFDNGQPWVSGITVPVKGVVLDETDNLFYQSTRSEAFESTTAPSTKGNTYFKVVGSERALSVFPPSSMPPEQLQEYLQKPGSVGLVWEVEKAFKDQLGAYLKVEGVPFPGAVPVYTSANQPAKWGRQQDREGYDFVYFVDPKNGDDATGQPNTDFAYKTLLAANNAAAVEVANAKRVLVYRFKGVSKEHGFARDMVDMEFERGALIWSDQPYTPIISDQAVGHAITLNIYGHGEFYHKNNHWGYDQEAFNFRYASKVYIEAARADSIQLWGNGAAEVELRNMDLLLGVNLQIGKKLTVDKCRLLTGVQLSPYNSAYSSFISYSCEFLAPNGFAQFATIKDITGATVLEITPLVITELNTSNMTQAQVADYISPQPNYWDLSQAIGFYSKPGWNYNGMNVEIYDPVIRVQKEKAVGLRLLAQSNMVGTNIVVRNATIHDETPNASCTALVMGEAQGITQKVGFDVNFRSDAPVLTHVVQGMNPIQLTYREFGADETGPEPVDLTNYYTKSESDAKYALKGEGGTANSVSWESITAKPTAFNPAAHNHSIAEVSGLQPALDAKGTVKTVNNVAPDSNGNVNITVEATTSVSWDNVTAKPTTFTPSVHSHAISEVADLQTELNSRIKTVNGQAPDADGNVVVATGPGEPAAADWNTITNKPSTFTPSTHGHAISEITNLQNELNQKAASNHTHADMVKSVNGITPDGSGNVVIPTSTGDGTADWNSITNKPTTFTPSAHSHAISEVAELEDELNSKAAANHTHSYESITGKPSAFTPTPHTHQITDIANLQSIIDHLQQQINDLKTCTGCGSTDPEPITSEIYVWNATNAAITVHATHAQGGNQSFSVSGQGTHNQALTSGEYSVEIVAPGVSEAIRAILNYDSTGTATYTQGADGVIRLTAFTRISIKVEYVPTNGGGSGGGGDIPTEL